MKIELSREEMDRIQNDDYLTDRERQVFIWYYRRGWHIETIAAELDVHRRTVDNILKSLRKKVLH